MLTSKALLYYFILEDKKFATQVYQIFLTLPPY